MSPPGNYELIPELAARLGPGIGLAHDGASLSQARPRRTGVLIAGLVATGLALLTTGIFFHAHVTKQFGLTPEVQEKLSDSHEAIRSQKQEKAALERPEQKAGPLIAIQPRVGAPEPKKEPVLAPKPTEDQLPPKPGNVSPPSALPEIAAKRPTTIKPLFCVLEEPPEAFAADARPQDIRLDDKNLEIKSMELIGADARHVAAGIGAADVPELVVLPKSSSTDSLIGGPPQHKLATFRASKRGVIEFTWCDGDSQERQRLRDCVLVVKAKNDEVKYLVLRSEPSSPKDSSEFQAHLDSQSSPKYMYTIYNWDDNGNYYNLYKNILITSCYLHTYEGKAKFDFKADGEGTWTIADEYGQPLLSVELSRVERQRDATTGGQKLVLHAPSGDVPIRRAARNKEPRRADKWLAVVIKLFDPDPLGLPRRIQEKEAEIAREKKDEGKSERRDKMREIEKQIKRLVKLNEIFRSLLNLKIVWNVEGVKLEIAHMDARKLVQDAGP